MKECAIDATINQAIEPLTQAIKSLVFFKIPLFGGEWPFVVLWLVAGALYFTISHKGINLKGLPLATKILRGDYDVEDAPGQISHAQALSAALSGTVGIGNIGGVAIAIAAGGPGATLWMIVAGLLGGATKYVECTLGVKYRQINEDQSISGGPMHYLSQGLSEKGFVMTGKGLGILYALGMIVGCLGIGNMFQSNQAFEQFVVVTGGQSSWFANKGWLFGIFLAAGVGSVILGGVTSIAKVTVKLVPFMGVLYISGTLAVIALNAEFLPRAIAAIWEGAFNAEGVAGGMIGCMVIGFQRAVFSNEAGIGSASIAHAAVKTNVPATEGLVALFGPLIDTVIICTLTALVIGVTTQADPTFITQSEVKGVAMTSAAFGRVISWSSYPLAFAALLFAFSTAISWSYYGLKGFTYVFGEAKGTRNLYKLIFCIFIALGPTLKIQNVLDFSDALVFLLCIPNIIGLVVLTPVIKREYRKLMDRVQGLRQ